METVSKQFTATLQPNPDSGTGIYLVWPESVTFFKTKGLVKVKGTIDGHPFRSAFMALGNGSHKLPVRASLRRVLGKSSGDAVDVCITERLQRAQQ